MATTKKKSSNKPKVVTQNKFHKAPVSVGSDCITVKLPRSIVEYLNISGEDVYWAAVNGVVQISGAQPTVTIPMMTAANGAFIPQPTE